MTRFTRGRKEVPMHEWNWRELEHQAVAETNFKTKSKEEDVLVFGVLVWAMSRWPEGCDTDHPLFEVLVQMGLEDLTVVSDKQDPQRVRQSQARKHRAMAQYVWRMATYVAQHQGAVRTPTPADLDRVEQYVAPWVRGRNPQPRRTTPSLPSSKPLGSDDLPDFVTPIKWPGTPIDPDLLDPTKHPNAGSSIMPNFQLPYPQAATVIMPPPGCESQRYFTHVMGYQSLNTDGSGGIVANRVDDLRQWGYAVGADKGVVFYVTEGYFASDPRTAYIVTRSETWVSSLVPGAWFLMIFGNRGAGGLIHHDRIALVLEEVQAESTPRPIGVTDSGFVQNVSGPTTYTGKWRILDLAPYVDDPGAPEEPIADREEPDIAESIDAAAAEQAMSAPLPRPKPPRPNRKGRRM